MYIKMRRRPSTCLYNVRAEGPRMRKRCGRWGVGVEGVGRREGCYTRTPYMRIILRHTRGPTLSNSWPQPFHCPAPRRSALLTTRSSKNACAGSQSPASCDGSSVLPCPCPPIALPLCSTAAYMRSMSAFSASTCSHGRGREERASRTPSAESRKPRWPCSAVRRRRKTDTPGWVSLVK